MIPARGVHRAGNAAGTVYEQAAPPFLRMLDRGERRTCLPNIVRTPAILWNRERRGDPWRGTVCGRGLLAWTRGQPPATDVGSHSYPYHITRTYCSLARPPHTHSLVRVLVTAISRMRAASYLGEIWVLLD
jgi:hypothetical protein